MPTERAELYAIYLLPESQRGGHGRALLERTLEGLRGQGYEEVSLWVLSANEAARGFYDAAGFSLEVEAEARELQGFTVVESRYVKRLDA